MKLKNIILVTMVGFFLSACTEPSLESSSYGLNSQPALWVASSKQSRVYLFGSIHVLPKEVKWYGPKLRESFEASEELVFETLSSEENKNKFIAYGKKHGLLPDGKVISDYLTDSEYQRYTEIVELTKMDKYFANRMKPWLFYLSLNAVATKELRRYGVDGIFEKAARKRGKRVASLESVQSALSALSSTPLSKDIKNLKKMLNKPNSEEKRKKEILKKVEMVVSWTTGDTERTERLLAQETPSTMYNNVIIKRNNQWYSKIKQYLKKEQTTMIIVGQAHLLGRGNLIQKLKRDGYKVERVQ
ncbi:TraB/GumN family protein [Sulfurovum mangrovi]|uniref:TraB/GumN family protein n=1 Tax=Sulfurovum mangrovi TaxID=2893889 RepID=UPI001E4E91D7|nr:TraB/GumN family protein [Sulfurovum mangrovi]UFH59429.1 TraB/GumN family protein [Sulfurovum mangrovi]